MRIFLALPAALALLPFSAERARAEGGWGLFIEDGAACVTGADLASRVTARTGAPLAVLERPLHEQAAAGIENWIEGRSSREGGETTLALALRDAGGALIGERVLERPDAACEELRDAAVLAIAVMMGKGESLLAPPPAPPPANIDASEESPQAQPPQAEPPVESEPEPSPAPAAAAPEPEPERRSSTYRAPLHARLFAGAAISADVVPGIAAHATLTLRVIQAIAWPLELSLVAFGASEAELSEASNGRASFSPLYGVLAVCPLGAGSGAVRADACLGVLGGVALTSASGFTRRNGDHTQALAGLVVRLPISLRIAGPLSIRATATMGTPLVYYELKAVDAEQDEQVIAENSPLFGSLDLTLGLDLF